MILKGCWSKDVCLKYLKMYVDKCKLCINMIFVQIEKLNYVDRNEVQCLVKEKHHEVLITHITPSKVFKSIPWLYCAWYKMKNCLPSQIQFFLPHVYVQ